MIQPTAPHRSAHPRCHGIGVAALALLLGGSIALGVPGSVALASETGSDMQPTGFEVVEEQERIISEAAPQADEVALTPEQLSDAPGVVLADSGDASETADVDDSYDVLLEDGHYSYLTMRGSLQSGTFKISLPSRSVIYLSYSATNSNSSNSCLVSLNDASGNGVLLPSARCDFSDVDVYPVALPAGDYYLKVIPTGRGSNATTVYAYYRITDFEMSSGWAMEYELADQGTPATAVPVGEEGFFGFHYNLTSANTSAAYTDADYFSFEVTDNDQFTEVWVMGRKGLLFGVEDADGNILTRNLDANGTSLSARGVSNFGGYGSDTYGYRLECGKLPAGTYYIVVVNEDSSSAGSMYGGSVSHWPFSDVNRDTSHVDDINWLAGEGISTGWELYDGTREFRPNAQIARGDMAAFLYRLAGSPAYDAPATSPFSDVTPRTSHYKEICWLAETGVSTGWRNADGTRSYRPNSPVARGDMAAFLHRMSDKGLVASW